jgi:hypothetical protein
MDIFNSVDKPISPVRSEKPRQKDEQEKTSAKDISRRKEVTDQQIREKLAARLKDSKVDISKKAKNHPGKKLASAEDAEIIGDIGDNDPNNDMTQEKLRKILDSKAFHFNEKERKTLEEILYRS